MARANPADCSVRIFSPRRGGSEFAPVPGMSLIRRLSQGSAKVALTVAIGSGSVAAFQLVSVKDEIAIGQQAQQELRRETPQVGDARVREYVSRPRHPTGAARVRGAIPVQLLDRRLRRTECVRAAGRPGLGASRHSRRGRQRIAGRRRHRARDRAHRRAPRGAADHQGHGRQRPAGPAGRRAGQRGRGRGRGADGGRPHRQQRDAEVLERR